MAYASQSAVVVIDTKNIQVVQCLSRNKHPIKKVFMIILQLGFEVLTLFVPSCLDFVEPFEGRKQWFKSKPCSCWHQWMPYLLERERWQSYFIRSGRQQIGCWYVNFIFAHHSIDFLAFVIVLFVCSYGMGAQNEQRWSFISCCPAFSLQPCHMEYGQGLERMEEEFHWCSQ